MAKKSVDVLISGSDGEVVYEKKGFIVPESWSERSAVISASKYSQPHETSIYQIVDRVVDTITQWGIESKYLEGNREARLFSESLKDIILDQRGSPNTPIWLNLGVETSKPVVSACFLGKVDDTLEDIFAHVSRSAEVFRSGSGIGVNVSKLRAKGENLSNFGYASGPLAFMKSWDRAAAAIRSGGRSRRSAVMLRMDADHPDIEEFINCKSIEEKKAHLLMANGYSHEEAYATIDYQNANHSVGLTDEFMRCVQFDKTWDLINRGDGKVVKTIKAKDLFRSICQRAWESGDPGLQFDDTINRFNPIPDCGKIESSNPCFSGDMYLLTKEGYKTFGELSEYDSVDICGLHMAFSKGRVWSNGIKPVCKISFENTDMTLKCTYNHVYRLEDGSECMAMNLEGKTIQSFSEETGLLKVVNVVDAGMEEVFDFTEPVTHWGVVSGNAQVSVITSNCGEVLAIPQSCCLLFSFNLLKYFDKDSDDFIDWEMLDRDSGIVVTAMNIMIDNASYPTEDFKRLAINSRPLGIGTSNLGALLIKANLAYGNDKACSVTKSIMQELSSCCGRHSIELAKSRGSYAYSSIGDNLKHTAEVFSKYCSGSPELNINTIMKNGILNSQVTTAAPTGTTGMQMGVDSTGIEPLFALTTTKNLVGGGTMVMVPEVVIEKLKEWGIKFDLTKDSIEDIVKSLPKDKQEIFWTANEIPVERHIALTAAVQSGISGGVSRTINMPNNATVEDVEKAYMMAWSSGLKGVTIYRDGSKLWQPLTSKKEEIKVELPKEDSVEVRKVWRRKLPDTRQAATHKFNIGGFEGYITAGIYPEGTLGEIFIRASKSGSTIQGLLDSFGTAISMAIQYGVPLDKLVDKFTNIQFDPRGFTTNPQVRTCTSVIDYVFQWLKTEFQEEDLLEDADEAYKNAIEVPVSALVNSSGNVCSSCGSGAAMVRTGSCWTCSICGSGGGCGG